jgi:hypothetical protein
VALAASLYVIFLGLLTDWAFAYLLEPKIADKLNVEWIGGDPWPNGGWEFNEDDPLLVHDKTKLIYWIRC